MFAVMVKPTFSIHFKDIFVCQVQFDFGLASTKELITIL